MSDTQKFEIKRKYILGLGRWLQGLTLSGRESRERTKFVESLADEVKESEAMRLEVLKKYAEIDPETKEPVTKEENGSVHFVIPDEEMSKFADEMNTYLEDNFVVEGEGNIQRLKVVKNIVLNTDEKITPEFSNDYDKWCEAFEKVEA